MSETGHENQNTTETEEKKTGWFGRLRSGLNRSAGALGGGINDIFTKRKLDDAALADLEDLLITCDLGLETAAQVTQMLSKNKFGQDVSSDEVRSALAEHVANVLRPIAVPLQIDGGPKPHIALVVGVNGSGKTTTIGKLAQQFSTAGKSVMLAAGDTFRAAAIEQLEIWGERTGAPVITAKPGSDAAGLIYGACEKARAENRDILLIDTAGRLQNKSDLMAELEKVVRVIKKVDDTAPHSVLLVLDATTGQNALNQIEVFRQVCNVTGLIMTKLDGTARGGVLVAVAEKFGLPVHAIGVGEGVDDLQPFEADAFARALVGLDT